MASAILKQRADIHATIIWNGRPHKLVLYRNTGDNRLDLTVTDGKGKYWYMGNIPNAIARELSLMITTALEASNQEGQENEHAT